MVTKTGLSPFPELVDQTAIALSSGRYFAQCRANPRYSYRFSPCTANTVRWELVYTCEAGNSHVELSGFAEFSADDPFPLMYDKYVTHIPIDSLPGCKGSDWYSVSSTECDEVP